VISGNTELSAARRKHRPIGDEDPPDGTNGKSRAIPFRFHIFHPVYAFIRLFWGNYDETSYEQSKPARTFHSVTPYLWFKECQNARFLKQHQPTELERVPRQTERSATQKYELAISSNDGKPTPSQRPLPTCLRLRQDVDRCTSAMQAGVKPVREFEGRFYDHAGGVVSSVNQWWMSKHKEDVSRRIAQAMEAQNRV